MAEGGYPKIVDDSESESSSLFSIRRAKEDNTSETFVSVKGDYSTLGSSSSVPDEWEADNDSDKTYVSIKGYEGSTSENTSEYMSVRGIRNNDSFHVLKEDENREESNHEEDVKERSDNEESLCASCLQDDIKTKATHICNNCGKNGKKMCYQCLRYHGKFTNHVNVKSLLTSTTSLKNFEAQSKTTVPHDQFTQDNARQRQTSRLKLKQFLIINLIDNEGYDCTAIDFAQMKNGNLIVADFFNKSLKIFRSDNFMFKEVFYLVDNPLCISCFPNDVVAVGYNDALCLDLLESKKAREIYRQHGTCYGLKCVGRYLYSLEGNAGSETVSIRHLQESGNLKLIKTIDLQQYNITEPYQIDVDKFGETIYITDAAFGIFVLDRNGRLWMKTPVNAPRGISFDGSNRVFICCNESNNILELDRDAAIKKTFLSEKHGVSDPCAVFVDRIKRRLFVGMLKSNSVFYIDI